MTQYDDIIHLPHHVSKKHPPMSLLARAAQFAPFAACSAEMPGRSPEAQTPLPGMNIAMENKKNGNAGPLA